MKIDNVEQMIPFGNFIIEKPDNEEVKEKTSFVGYDYMIKFNIPYKNRVTFPCKAKVLFQDLCDQVGLVVGNIDFVNCDYMILGNPFTNNEDCRTVLSNIAQLAGGFAKIGRDNKVYIKNLRNLSNLLTVKYVNAMTVKELNLTLVKALSGERDNADENLNGNNYFDDFSKNEQWGELNSLVIGLSNIEGENTVLDDEDSIQKNGTTEIVIQDNYFLNSQIEREKVIEPIWNSLKGIKYLPFKTKYYGYPYLDCGDLIYIEDTKDIGHISYVFNHTFKFDGAFSGSIETPALTKVQTAYKNTFEMKTRFRNAERRIDKINGIIEDIIEEQTETTNKLTQHEQTINAITDKVEQIEDVTNITEGIKTISLENCVEGELLELHVYGNNTVFDYLYVSDDLYLSDDLYVYGDSRILVNDTIYELGVEEVLRQNEEACDEFILKDGQAKVIRRVNKSGSTKAKEKVENLGELKILLQEGTNTITIKNYSARLNARFAIKNSLTNMYATKVEMNSSITQTAEKINQEVNKKAGKEEMTSMISQTAESINREVSKKVDGDEIISRINQSAEQVSIQAEKISLSGKTLNLADNMAIVSNNFNVDKNGNMTCNNANIDGGTIKIYGGDANSSNFEVGTKDNSGHSRISGSYVWIDGQGSNDAILSLCRNQHEGGNNIVMSAHESGAIIDVGNGTIDNFISLDGINKNLTVHGPAYANSFNNNSSKELKKNITIFNESVLNKIKDSGIYRFNYKTESDEAKKHIGFIIGKGYKTPELIIADNGKGIDTYSMISILWRATQEMIEKNEILEKRIQELEAK